MKARWIIYDWAGNHCFQYKEFKTFEDAWEFLMEQYEHLEGKEFDEQLGDYYVEQKGARK